MAHTERESGFVLLMVLVVLTVCGTILTGVARRSGQAAVRAGSVQRDLQVRWGTLSLQATLLPMAERLLRERNALDEPALVEVRRSVALGGMAFQGIVSDEQAKANVNTLAQRDGDVKLVVRLRQLQASRARPLRVRLRPSKDERAATPGAPPTRYSSFDQVFVFSGPAELRQSDAPERVPVARRLTLWGSGKINLRRAERQVLREVFDGLLTETQLAALDELRRTQPNLTAIKLFARLQLTKKQIDTLTPLVTDGSECHSLWVVAQGRTRDWHRFYVEAGQGPSDLKHWTFSW